MAPERPQAGPATPSSATSTNHSASETVPVHDEHAHRRFFLGLMPQKVATTGEPHTRHKKRNKLLHISESDENDTMARIIGKHAQWFFVKNGGKAEDWGENEERSVREEMLRRWTESGWMRKTDVGQTDHWVGKSFEIGDLLGINILQDVDNVALSNHSIHSSTRRGTSSTHLPLAEEDEASTKAPLISVSEPPSSTIDAASFVTAPSQPPSAGFEDSAFAFHADLNGDSDHQGASGSSARSSSPLLRLSPPQRTLSTTSQARTEVHRRPAIKIPSMAQSDTMAASNVKGKRVVHYADSPMSMSSPALPADVLGRTGEDVEDTSAGAMSVPNIPEDIGSDDVVMRDRMLVRISYSKTGLIPSHFDEVQHRTTQGLTYEGWGEYMVVWRKTRIEIYENYSTPWKESIVGHKHRAFVIPLGEPVNPEKRPVGSPPTRLSLYSFVDLSFCLTCPPTSTHKTRSKTRSFFGMEKEGRNIFVLKPRSRTRAADWIWHLWWHLGGQLPPLIEVWNPSLNTKLKIQIPAIRTSAVYRMFTRENIVALCSQSLRSVPEFKAVVERQLSEGKVLELAWRIDTNLDWIWLEDDITGDERQWAVLFGLALKQYSSPAHLEIRLGEHYPSYLHVRGGTRLVQPPAIEGYLDRVRPNTQTKEQVYLATHDGNIFSVPPSRAHPPTPLDLVDAINNPEGYAQALRQSEVQRGALQIMSATGVADLRSVLVIRRAFHVSVPHTHTEREEDPGDDQWANVWAQPDAGTDSDQEDEGGDEGLGKAGDKAHLRMKRSFELLLKSGHVIRFEAHSRRVALEWIERLRALVAYWKQRHRIDARQEMDVAQSRRPRITPQKHVHQNDSELPPEPPADPSAALPALGSLYSWCTLDGCKSIVRGGKIYMRRGLQGHFKRVHMFLVAGHLVNYRIRPKYSLHTAMKKKISLQDAYVGSGYFAAQALPNGQYNPTANSVPRRYQDGLETDDPEEDILFMIWYRAETPSVAPGKDALPAEAPVGPVPALAAKRKAVVFRTRSKLERDSWCWAINCEIEKLMRAQKEREVMLRETGGLVKDSE